MRLENKCNSNTLSLSLFFLPCTLAHSTPNDVSAVFVVLIAHAGHFALCSQSLARSIFLSGCFSKERRKEEENCVFARLQTVLLRLYYCFSTLSTLAKESERERKHFFLSLVCLEFLRIVGCCCQQSLN